jgi:hypothetical protein
MKNSESANQGTMLLHHFLVTLLLWSQGHYNHQKGFTGINHTFLSLYCFGVKAITATRRFLLASITLSCHFIALESRPSQPPEGFYWWTWTCITRICDIFSGGENPPTAVRGAPSLYCHFIALESRPSQPPEDLPALDQSGHITFIVQQ